MRKPLSILIIMLQLSWNIFSQSIYYSPIENNEPSKTLMFVIGEVNKKLLVWKEDLQAHTSTLLIYNERMELFDKVKEKPAGNNIIKSLKFFKTQNGFYADFEFTQRNDYFCNQNFYDENGNQIGGTKTIEHLKLNEDTPSRLSFMRMLTSEQGNKAILYRQYITNANDSMVVEYCEVNNKLDSSGLKFIGVPLHNKGQLTNLLLDEYGNLLIGESYPSFDSTGFVLKIYKHLIGTDSLQVLKQTLPGSYLSGTKMISNIKNDGYIIYGILTEKINAGSTRYHPIGLFTSIVDLNLKTKFEPQETDFSSISSMPKYDNLQIEKVIPSPDGGYYLYFLNNAFYENTLIRPYTQTLGYRQVIIPSASIIPSGYLFSRSGYLEEYMNAQRDNIAPIRRYEVSETRWMDNPDQLKSMNLIIFKFNSNNQLESGGVLKGDAEAGFISRVDMSGSFLLGNDLHFIYPKIISQKKQVIGEISFDASGKTKASHLIANQLKYFIRTCCSAKVNDHSVILKYDNNYKIGFVKVDY